MHSSRFSELAGCEVSHGCFQHHHHHWLRHHRRHHHRYAVHKLFQSDPILRIPREVCSVSTWLPSSSSFFKRRLMFAFIVLQITMVSRSPKMILPRRWRQSFLTGFLVYRPTGLHLVSPLVRQCFLQSTNVVRCFFSWWWRCLCNFIVMTVLISSMIWIKMFLPESKSVSVYICLCYFFSGVLNPCCPFQSFPFF